MIKETACGTSEQMSQAVINMKESKGSWMKFFHISDLHIGKQLHHYNMLEEQRDILAQVVSYAKEQQPNAVLIAGDIYDTPVPSAEAVAVFDEFLTELCAVNEEMEICIIAGNHDSAKRIDFASAILAKHRVNIAGMPPREPEQFLKKVTIADTYGNTNIYLLPFVKPAYVRKLFEEEEGLSYDTAVKKLLERETINLSERNILVSHQFYTTGNIEPETSDSEVRMVGGIENVDAAVLAQFDYAALGHIHKGQKIAREENRYSGTLLQYSVSEATDEKTLLMVEINEKGTKPILNKLPLKPMRKVRRLVGGIEEILAMATAENCHDFVSITLTDEVEAYHPKERLEAQYDHILEIKIDNARTRKLLEFSETEIESLEPYDAFGAFFKEMNGRDMTEEEDALIREIINCQKEELA